MVAVERTALILLAAGASRRFGAADKLAADVGGRPLGLHVVAALADVPFAARIAVVDGCRLDFAAHGYRVIRNDDAASGMAGSIRLGVARAKAEGADAVLIVLADMPRVTAGHVARLFAAAEDGDAVVASSDGVRPMPPALFGADRFDALLALEGDAGARAMIRAARHVVANAGVLVDVDTVGDLARVVG
ncbi:MobA [Sphingomonas sp. Leaf17]|uniref:nucleotidyltransferase family protein n=1 Tax=Sphingomonas sp. Leaf17 TaxID=1735683 RepID=UPI0006F43538|nr:nucleotidyltransferase family protein [Sphingomonas sp. Leaf17]KQM63360.1 MobA [Sphingomonas sp. Leaf17]